MPISDLVAVQIVEGERPADDTTYYKAWQHLIDTGTVFQLQGWYGRTARDLIAQGKCQPPKEQRQ